MLYSLKDINTRDFSAVKTYIAEAYLQQFPGADSSFIDPLLDTVELMFDGRYKNFGEFRTKYHDREHTLQASICMNRLMQGRILSGESPPLTADHFRIGLTAILMHDVGYMQDQDDHEGTGAKYTLEHEQRSCDITAKFLQESGWSGHDIQWVQHLINCTGPRSLINVIEFENETERFLGQAVCTADYLGQMADYQYIRKLPVLFQEFKESDDYQGIPEAKRMFSSAGDLISKTPGFWGFVQKKVLEGDCGNVFRYLARPVPDGCNPYLEKINRTMSKLDRMITNNEVEALVAELS